MNRELVISDEAVVSKIFYVRGNRVMIDYDLAELYQVPTKALKQAVKRNLDIFPENFMFELTSVEFENLRSQIVTSSWGGIRYLPFAFTEHGVLQLANVLRSEIARKMSIRIIEVFVKMREMFNVQSEIIKKLEMLDGKFNAHDEQLTVIFEYLNQLEDLRRQELKYQNRKKIGYKTQ